MPCACKLSSMRCIRNSLNWPRSSRSKSEYRGTLVEAFKKKDMPRIAISVDMLDTGIDVPEVRQLSCS